MQLCNTAKRRSVVLAINSANKRWRRRLIVWLLAWCVIPTTGCHVRDFPVERATMPDYPVTARMKNIQGTVEIGIEIAMDGTVLWAHGSGSSPILVEAAEKNAREWRWGPFPPVMEFPTYREVSYTYRLEGNPQSVVVEPPTVRTHLPDRIEVIAVPFKSDLDEIEKNKVPISR